MFKHLFSPGQIGSMKLKNRIVMSPMGNYLANPDGTVSEADIAFYSARAKGGVGLIFTECMFVESRRGRGNTHQISAAEDRCVEGLQRLAEAIHALDSKIVAQIYHPGRQGVSAVNDNLPMLAPSAIECAVVHQPAVMMTTAEVQNMVSHFVAAAGRVQEAGFDGVEVHGAHGYLINEFLSPYTNQRTDQYGGSFDNRMRFLSEIVSGIRSRCGADFPLIVRLSVDEFLDTIGRKDQGLKLADGIEIAKRLEQLGIDAVDVSSGIYETMSVAWEPASYDQGWKIYLSEAIKKAVNIPVIGVSAIRDPEYAERVLEEGKLDFVGSARQHFADPEWANKAREGRVGEIRKCISCLLCMESLISADMTGTPCRCSINIEGGRESVYVNLRQDGEGRTVAIIGGGPAGMEAARILSARKFKPVIFEKQSRLGGQLVLAAKPPKKEKLNWLIQYLQIQMQKLQVDVRLNTEANLQQLQELDPYAVFVAQGSEPLLPRNIKGLDSESVCTAQQVLSGERSFSKQKVAVIGSGMTGIETAELLAGQGKTVTVFEMADEIGPGLYFQNLLDVLARLQAGDVQLLIGHRLMEIREHTAVFQQVETSEIKEYDFDGIVMSLGNISSSQGVKELTQQFQRVSLLGDAVRPGRIRNALENAYNEAYSL